MKKFLTFPVCLFLVCTCLFSGAAAVVKTDTEDSDKWERLVENFKPDVIYQEVDDLSAVSECYPEIKLTVESEKALEDADPRSAVAYNLRTGEISITPYEPSEEAES